MQLSELFFKKTENIPTPFLAIDLDALRANYRRLKHALQGIEVFYSMKANDHPKIIEVLSRDGCSFEIASIKELELLIKYKVPPEKIVCFHSIKTADFLKKLRKYKVKIMAFDSFEEVDKIAKYFPRSEVVLRIVVNNEGSDWPLTRKFGVDAGVALDYLKYAKNKGLVPIGLTFHVGSQCRNKNNWTSAIYVCEDIWEQAKRNGISLSYLSLGGGVPVKHTKAIPTPEEINEAIMPALKKLKAKNGNVRVTIEPGRGLVGDAGIMSTTVIGKAKRESEDWIYIDIGVFNGLMETVEGFEYEIGAEGDRIMKTVTIGGPSCDSVDIPFKNIIIPEVSIGERLYIINSCAYTTVYAAPFNGFPIPKVYFI